MENQVVLQCRKDRLQELWTVFSILLFGCAVRLFFLGAIPFGLNQDEASAGYEAFALLTEGMDRCGKNWPVLFISWGSGQNVLMSYLAIPFVALFGLNEFSIRLPNAIAGCLTLLVFWLYARRCGGRKYGITALFLLAFNPWHIMMSRWALESNLLPLFLMTGIWLTSVAEDYPWALTGAAFCFGLSLYAYGTAFFFLPLYLICAVLWLRKHFHWKSFLVALLLFMVLAFPIALCQAINVFGWEERQILGMTLPKLTESRQAATSVFGGGGFHTAMENARGFLKILKEGGDGLPWNALPFWKGGIFYFFGLPTAVLGIFVSFLDRKNRGQEAPMRIAIVSALLCAFLIRCNVNRINMIWLPLIWFSAVGIQFLLDRIGKWSAVPICCGIAVCFFVFLNTYLPFFGGEGYVGYFPGLGETIEYAEQTGAGTVYITDYVNQPYIFALFYTQASPSDFAESVEYRYPEAAFRPVDRFDGFEFRDSERADVLILHRYATGGRRVLYEAGIFAVCEKQ